MATIEVGNVLHLKLDLRETFGEFSLKIGLDDKISKAVETDQDSNSILLPGHEPGSWPETENDYFFWWYPDGDKRTNPRIAFAGRVKNIDMVGKMIKAIEVAIVTDIETMNQDDDDD